MNKTWLLYKTMFRDGFNFTFKTKQGRKSVLLLVVICLVVLIYMGIYGMMAWMAFEQGQFVMTIRSLLMIISVLLVLMLMASFPSTYYFSKDLPILLAMPVKSREIINAKTLMIFSMVGPIVLALVMTFVVAAAKSSMVPALQTWMLLIYGLSSSVATVFILGSLIVLLMRFIPFFRSKDKFVILMGLFSVVLVIAMLAAVYGNMPMDAAGSEDDFNVVVALGGSIPVYLFPAAGAAFEGIAAPSLWTFLLNAAVLAASYGMFQLLVSRFYLVAATSAMGSAAKKHKDKSNKRMSGSLLMLFSRVDLYELIRTPAYLSNNVLGAFLLPVAFAVPVFMVLHQTGLDSTQISLMVDSLLEQYDLSLFWVAVLVGMAVGYLAGGSTAVTQTAITREASAGVAWMKSIPVPMEKQLQAKINVALLLSMLCSLILIGVIVYMTGFRWASVFGAILGALVSCYLSCQTSLLVDIYHPKLDWEDEMSAVKNNLNVLFGMMVSFLMAVVIGLGAWGVYALSHSLTMAIVAVFIIQIILVVLLWKIPARMFWKYLANTAA